MDISNNDNNNPTTNVLLSTKDNQNLAFKRVVKISLNDGKNFPPPYYDNETTTIINKNYDYKLLFRFLIIIMIIICFFLALEVIVNYLALQRNDWQDPGNRSSMKII